MKEIGTRSTATLCAAWIISSLLHIIQFAVWLAAHMFVRTFVCMYVCMCIPIPLHTRHWHTYNCLASAGAGLRSAWSGCGHAGPRHPRVHPAVFQASHGPVSGPDQGSKERRRGAQPAEQAAPASSGTVGEAVRQCCSSGVITW